MAAPLAVMVNITVLSVALIRRIITVIITGVACFRGIPEEREEKKRKSGKRGHPLLFNYIDNFPSGC